MTLFIDENYAGLTIKKVLFDKLSFSRGAITELKKKERGIEVGGEHKTVRYVLQKGDVLTLLLDDTAPSERIKSSSGDIDIIYEDDSIIALNKPENLAVHPSKKIQDDTLAGRLINARPNTVFRAMGRLDKNTSGIVVCSKTRVAAAKLFSEISERRVKKEYILISFGKELPQKGTINFGIVRDNKSYIKRICIPENEASESEKAITEYEILLEKDGYKLIKATPVTGRTHQLRAHFSAMGNPILGDDMYGEKSEIIERQALHAYRLTFSHPETSKPISLVSPLRPDMLKAAETVFGKEKIDFLLSHSL